MELQEKRESFVKNLKEFLNKVDLSDKFWEKLENHQKRIFIESVKKFKDEQMAQKIFILLEFTRDENTFDNLVEILRKSGQSEASQQLASYRNLSRREIIENLSRLCDLIQLNDVLMKDIEGYVPSEYLECLKNLKKQELTQKVFIFLEFTRERSTCEAMIEILKESGQEVVANELALYNKSPGLNEVSEDKLLIVQLSRQEMKGTEIYSMNKPVRGKCLIINNEMNLEKESQRFEDIFRQLHFDVEVHFKMTTAQMRNKFETLVKDPTLVGNNAFILMTISHGRDESVVGYNSTTNSADFNDILNISEIVEIFASCKALFRKPKLFFFTCCRIIRESALENLQTQQLSTTNGLGAKTLSEEIEAWQQNSAEIEKLEEDERIIPFNGINHKKDVFICYACAEGEETFYDNGYTHFGQALSHSIAQFACEKNLQTIMSRTCDFMNIKVKRMLRSAPEVRALDLRKQLFFNPGIPKKRSKN